MMSGGFFLFKGLIDYLYSAEKAEKAYKHETLYLNSMGRLLVEEQIIEW